MSSPRVRKIADRIKVIVAEMLERRIKDPRLGFVTVTDVRVTGDNQQATIYYTVLGAGADQQATAVALESAKGLLRSEVGKQLGMRHVPSLSFEFDGIPAMRDAATATRVRLSLTATSGSSRASGFASKFIRSPSLDGDDLRNTSRNAMIVGGQCVADQKCHYRSSILPALVPP